MTAAGPLAGADVAVPHRDRLAWLDNLRTFLTALVLLHHSALTYSHIPLWTYWEQPHDSSAAALDILLGANQTWFMGLFFLVSGYFVPSSVDRHGVAAFLRGRLLRLGVPIVVFVVLLRPLFVLPSWLTAPDRGSFWSAATAGVDPGPLWFLEVLLVFSLGYAALRAIADDGPADEGSDTGADAVRLWAVVAIGLGLGVASYLWRFLVPDGSYWPVVGLPTPNLLPQYLLCLAMGCLAARRRWLTSIPTPVGLGGAALAVPSFVGCVMLSARGDALGGPGLPALAMAVLHSLAAVGIMTAVLAVFRAWFATTGSLRTWLAVNTFAVYVIHAPVLALLGLALASWAAPAVVKALGLCLLGALVCWPLAAGLRRIPGARRVF